jgi:release factor glutamine methyltransferase
VSVTLRVTISPPTIARLLQDACSRLTAITDTPRLDAAILLAEALRKPRSYLYAWPEQPLTLEQVQRFTELLNRRLASEPLAYIIGRREFWSLELAVTPATLIPRSETELLVELALDRIPPDGAMRIADLGTGSGAIALAIARERPKTQVIATDNSAAALTVACLNARKLGIDNVEFCQGDWCTALPGEPLDVIVCNPPYVAMTDPHLQRGDLRFEPVAALVAGPDGLDAIRSITAQAMGHLQAGGWLLLEHGYNQGEQVVTLLRARGFTEVADYRDAAGIDRVGCGRRPLY